MFLLDAYLSTEYVLLLDNYLLTEYVFLSDKYLPMGYLMCFCLIHICLQNLCFCQINICQQDIYVMCSCQIHICLQNMCFLLDKHLPTEFVIMNHQRNIPIYQFKLHQIFHCCNRKLDIYSNTMSSPTILPTDSKLKLEQKLENHYQIRGGVT